MQRCALYTVRMTDDVVSGTGTNRGRPPYGIIPVVVGPLYGEFISFVEAQVNVLPSDRQSQQETTLRASTSGEFCSELLHELHRVRVNVLVCIDMNLQQHIFGGVCINFRNTGQNSFAATL